MPEIKNTFTQGKMNKDLDERLVPKGQYTEALNIQVSTSDEAGVGTVQNILGNNRIGIIIPDGWECVGSIADEKNDVLYSFITDDTDSAIVEYTKLGGEELVLVDIGNNILNFSQGDIITGINVIDGFLLWTDGNTEPKKIDIERSKQGTTNITTNTKLYVDNAIVLDNAGNQIDITEEHITVIRKKPLRQLSVKINPAAIDNKKPLFEKIFPRFSYRYRYDDGEYSSYAPFTDVVFNSEYPIDDDTGTSYDENTAYDTREPYNSGMRNMIDSIELSDFISPIIPKDVVQVDILYKQENSSVIYLVEVIKNTDPAWFASGFNPSSSYKGNFTVSSENIYAALPENQLLRSWDNVPRKALAQEITGNRLVYGNYMQSYNLETSPTMLSDYDLRFHRQKDLHNEYDWVDQDPSMPWAKNSDFSQQTVAGIPDDWDIINSTNIIYNSTNENIEWNNVSSVLGSGGVKRLKQDLGGFTIGERYRITFDVGLYSGTMSGKLNIRLTDGSSNLLAFNNYTPVLGQNILEGDFVATPNNLSTTPGGSLHVNKIEIIVPIGESFTGVIDNFVIQKGVKRSYKTFSDGGFESVKSQRNYQLGVVYGDKYGRETPVFTSPESSVVIPWENNFISSLPLASHSLQLKTLLSSPHPTWADYYKFFVKETSGEYYNLVMDAMYNPTKEDLEEDQHVWLSFASSDRNKISKEDYLILKKKIDPDYTGLSLQVEEENKFKILDIKNEVPDAVKYKYIKMGEVANDLSTSSGILNAAYSSTSGVFHEPNHRPLHPGSNLSTSGGSYDTSNVLWVNRQAWGAIGGSRLVEGDDSATGEQKPVENLYFSFTRTNANTAGDNQSSQKKYRVVSVEVEGNVNPYYKIKLSESITEADNDLIKADPTSQTNLNLHKDVIIRFEKKIIKDAEAFSGRFFVKILSNNLVKSELEVNPASLLDIIQNYIVGNTAKAFWHADTPTPGVYDITGGLVNNSGSGSVPGSNHVSSITSLSAGVTNTEAAWSALLTEMDKTPSRFFVDNMYMVAVQTGEYARHATYGWSGGNANVIGDVYWATTSSSALGYMPAPPSASWDSEYYGNSQYGYMYWPADNQIQLTQWPIGSTGDYLINGLEGIVTTSSMHVDTNSSVGLRKWRDINWNKNSTTWNLTNEYGSTTGKPFIHISYLAPGDDLHDGSLSVTNSNLSTNTTWVSDAIAKETQSIFGGGVFTSGSDPVFMEYQNSPYATQNQPVPGKRWGYGGYYGADTAAKTLHDNQWNISSATDLAFVNNFQPGKKFRFTADSNKTIYTIVRSNYSNPKKIYNHTPWRTVWQSDGAGGVAPVLDANGDDISVEGAVTAWANTTDSVGQNGNSLLVDKIKTKLQDFGNKNNRRLVYILELDKDPTDPVQNGGYNPIDGTNLDSISPDTIEFITEDFELNAGEISQNPAIWETEPKDNVDLDIYYEAGQAYPITLTEENIELFAPVGSVVSFPDDTRPLNGVDSSLNPQIITPPIYIGSWDGLELVFSKGVNQFWNNNGVGESINYVGIKIRFTNEDGSYTTATITGATPDPDTPGFMKSVTIQPTTETGLGWYNCFSFGNGVESNRIRDDFNAMTITNGVRANSTLDKPYEEEHRKSGLIYSGIYNSKNGINNLNQFVMAEKITKDLNPTYGSIQKLFTRAIRQSSSLIAFCEDRIISMVTNKDALYNADGNPQLISSNAILGDANPFVGEYGISQNPESFAKESYRVYFADKQRGAVLRLSMDGLTPISNLGMSDWFKDEFKNDSHLNIIGSFDNYKNNYNLTFDRGEKTYGLPFSTFIRSTRSTGRSAGGAGGENPTTGTVGTTIYSYTEGTPTGLSQTITFNESVKGWTSFKSFIQESGVSMSGDYYTFYNGRCWKHHDNQTRNSFYGTPIASTIKFLLNDSPLTIKSYNTLNYDGDNNWQCDSVVTDQEYGTVAAFIEKEGKWFNYIKTDATARIPDDTLLPLDTKAFNFQGIGRASLVERNI